MQWFRRAVVALAKVLPVIERSKLARWAHNLDEADLVDMAMEALRRAPETLNTPPNPPKGKGVLFSTSGDARDPTSFVISPDGTIDFGEINQELLEQSNGRLAR